MNTELLFKYKVDFTSLIGSHIQKAKREKTYIEILKLTD